MKLGCLLPVLLIFTFTAQASPKLEVAVHMDQSMVRSGTTIQGDLLVSNTGDKPLKIRGIETSCGCTTIQMEKRMIEAGSSAVIRFEVDTRGKIGRIEKTITLHTNEPESPRIIPVVFHAREGQDLTEGLKELFRPPCDSCHLTPAGDLAGKALFQAVCVMCHPAETLKVRVVKPVEYVIRFGLNQIGMPAFGDYLSESKIRSLATWIHELEPSTHLSMDTRSVIPLPKDPETLTCPVDSEANPE
ncbi:MAG: DUF1573 domain-containing protein [SAR324 cluster bacterium]|nr:DUF1573 domain-containing protein [SAR324 cluster bacterium]